MIQKALIEAVENAHTLKSHAGDWNNQEPAKNWCMCYDMYHQTTWGATLLNLLGHNLLGQPLAILELGSGDHKTFKNLVTGIVNSKIVYHSVDRKPSLGVLIPKSAIDYKDDDTDIFQESNVMTSLTRTIVKWNKQILNKDIRVIERPLEHIHHQHDVFDGTDLQLPHNTFDVLIVDIEPHGREIELVDIFEPYMKDEYLIIFKCIGNMDLYGSTMADNVLRHLRQASKLCDMFAVTGCNSFKLTRDVLAVCTKMSRDFDGTLYESLLKKGRLEDYDSICVNPSEELVCQLMKTSR
jgi:hypothetical protein